MRRREFLSTLSTIGLAAASTQLGCTPAARAGSSATGRRRLRRVGVQLYSLRDDARRDLEGTIANIAAAGYNDVELLGSMNNFGMPAAQLRQVLDRHGLRAPSTHVSGNVVNELDRNLDEALTLGHQYIVVASLPIQGQRTLDDYRRWADRLNQAGQATLRRGVRMAFHNHANDLTPIDGQVPYDILIEATDPSLVRHQLDTGNTAMAGRDPIEYLRRYGNRFWLFHIKDVPQMSATHDTELGKGVIDFRRLLASIDDIHNKFLYVEQETYPGTPLESVRRDYSYLSTLEF